ncbi:hypothetical protein D3C85_1559400 [compost metagenome]
MPKVILKAVLKNPFRWAGTKSGQTRIGQGRVIPFSGLLNWKVNLGQNTIVTRIRASTSSALVQKTAQSKFLTKLGR